MAITALEVASAGWIITVVGWLVSPVIAFFLPKILSSLGFDASEKLQELEFNIIPKLQKTLQEVDEKRMLQRGEARRVKSDVATLDKMAAMLRHAREEVEDIFDDQGEIELYRSRSCWDILNGAAKACITCFRWIAGIVRSRSICLLHLTRTSLRLRRMSEAPSDSSCSSLYSSGWCLSCLCSSFSFAMNCSRSMMYWIIDVIAVARSYRNSFYRNWSYEEVRGTSYQQENATALDFLLTAISRRSLKRRIEKVESTVTEVKKSPLLAITSKSPPDEIVNKDRSRIRTASNREVFGREALRDYIMEKLRETPHDDAPSSSTSPCYSVMGIYGVAGSGKTTFARYTWDYLKDEEEELFDIIMCIHVSETFTVANKFHEMLKDITKEQHSDISDREELEEKLKELLRGKRFFLILDDLWVKTKNDPQLEQLMSPLNVGLKGSKILVTARTKAAAGALCGTSVTMEIPDLNEDQYLSMFMHYALGSTSVSDEEFIPVGRKIAEKLHRSPIAAVTVAGRLATTADINFWQNTAELDMLNDTMDALWWSYQQLSPDIRRCFEYCNIFPRRFKMTKVVLAHLWIAQGFVRTTSATDDMEVVAEGYIQELVSCSFIQPENTRNGEEFFRIHDLLHDLADMVTRTDYFRIENESSQRERWKGDIPRDVRHLFVQNYDAELITEKILGLGNLRTLIINGVGRDKQVEEKVIDAICKKLSKLRVLVFSLSNESIMQRAHVSIPESVCQLKYLRYLGFRRNRFCKINLPSTLNKLQHIQLLDFGNGDISEFTFAKLVYLRHIFCREYVKLPYVGRLSSLQTLPGFTVSNEQGCELKQLRDLNKIRGKLRIDGLENVKTKGQALQANLAAKRFTELTLQCYPECSLEVEADVLEGFCPPVGLQKLELWMFVGWRYPHWMVGKHNGGPKYLQELYIFECKLPVPPSGLAEAFLLLRVLRLFGCSWDALPDNMEHLTLLKELGVVGCFNIRSLPSLPQSLEKFTLGQCNDEFSKSCKTDGHPNWQKIEHIAYKYIG